MMEQEGLIGRLTRAAKLGDVAALAGALADGANANAGGSWPLQCAARRGHVECVRLLTPVSDPLDDDSLALRWAAKGGHAQCVRLLLPVSDPLANDSCALREAARGGDAQCVRLLLPASDPLAVGIDGLDAAGSARQGGHAQVAGMIEAFIEAQALSGLAQHSKGSPRAKSAL